MTDEELKALVAQNSQDIAGLMKTVGSLLEITKTQAEETVAVRELAKKTTEHSEKNEDRWIEQSQIIQNMLDEARADRVENRKQFAEDKKRFDAQQEVIQSMLVDLGRMNAEIDHLKAG